MTQAEYRAALKNSRCWAWSAYSVASIAMMLVLLSAFIVYFQPIHDASSVFRDTTKRIADDGMYGALTGLIFGTTIILTSAVFPLLIYVWVDRVLGLTCAHCGASLTSFRRSEHVLKNGVCTKCNSPSYVRIQDEPSDAPNDRASRTDNENHNAGPR